MPTCWDDVHSAPEEGDNDDSSISGSEGLDDDALSVQFRREVTVDTMLAEHREVRILISLSLQNYY